MRFFIGPFARYPLSPHLDQDPHDKCSQDALESVTLPSAYVVPFGKSKAFASNSPPDKELLGGKGAGLQTMCNLGIAVPPGFTLTTEACVDFQDYPLFCQGG